jgi:hypothetical protein
MKRLRISSFGPFWILPKRLDGLSFRKDRLHQGVYGGGLFRGQAALRQILRAVELAGMLRKHGKPTLMFRQRLAPVRDTFYRAA